MHTAIITFWFVFRKHYWGETANEGSESRLYRRCKYWKDFVGKDLTTEIVVRASKILAEAFKAFLTSLEVVGEMDGNIFVFALLQMDWERWRQKQ